MKFKYFPQSRGGEGELYALGVRGDPVRAARRRRSTSRAVVTDELLHDTPRTREMLKEESGSSVIPSRAEAPGAAAVGRGDFESIWFAREKYLQLGEAEKAQQQLQLALGAGPGPRRTQPPRVRGRPRARGRAAHGEPGLRPGRQGPRVGPPARAGRAAGVRDVGAARVSPQPVQPRAGLGGTLERRSRRSGAASASRSGCAPTCSGRSSAAWPSSSRSPSRSPRSPRPRGWRTTSASRSVSARRACAPCSPGARWPCRPSSGSPPGGGSSSPGCCSGRTSAVPSRCLAAAGAVFLLVLPLGDARARDAADALGAAAPGGGGAGARGELDRRRLRHPQGGGRPRAPPACPA